MGLPVQWLRHLADANDDTKKNFEGAIRNSTTLIIRFKEILQEELDSIERQDTSDKQFEDPNWSHKRAYWDGQRSKIRAHLNLFTFDQEK